LPNSSGNFATLADPPRLVFSEHLCCRTPASRAAV
jgi:hypothetical protein